MRLLFAAVLLMKVPVALAVSGMNNGGNGVNLRNIAMQRALRRYCQEVALERTAIEFCFDDAASGLSVHFSPLSAATCLLDFGPESVAVFESSCELN